MLLAAAEALGIDSPLIPRIATPFGGGLAHRGESCGAVNGALMAIGLARGRDLDQDPAVRDQAYDLAGRFMHQFETQFGALRCRDLTGLDWSQPDSRETFYASGQWDRCLMYVSTAVAILAELGVLPEDPETL
ncbi:MAG: C-GCAxxG-C-C family protein [Chloroflexi bacterium]|nr:C-GCAxxG-C-C family protein [Chloroflexota bacterium]MBU1746767.1 C-GCAxxG-C-C family protein [Chloroflexota bacterium]